MTAINCKNMNHNACSETKYVIGDYKCKIIIQIAIQWNAKLKIHKKNK